MAKDANRPMAEASTFLSCRDISHNSPRQRKYHPKCAIVRQFSYLDVRQRYYDPKLLVCLCRPPPPPTQRGRWRGIVFDNSAAALIFADYPSGRRRKIRRRTLPMTAQAIFRIQSFKATSCTARARQMKLGQAGQEAKTKPRSSSFLGAMAG